MTDCTVGKPLKKCVFVIGPEGTGSKITARICSEALKIQPFGEWDGGGWCDRGYHKVCHCSLPYRNPPRFPDIAQWISTHEDEYDLYFILTTRDITISHYSRLSRFSKSITQIRSETEEAKAVMVKVMRSGQKHFIWSYETFMFLKTDYLCLLYEFLGVDSDFVPHLVDGNERRIAHGWVRYWYVMRSRCERYWRSLMIRLGRSAP